MRKRSNRRERKLYKCQQECKPRKIEKHTENTNERKRGRV